MVPVLLAQGWSRDFCSCFDGPGDFVRRGLGVAALWEGVPVAGASSYIIYEGGIEIEIDTRPDHRRRGLAAVCGAALILMCLERGLYPSWDACDLRSVALAEKLGYRRGSRTPSTGCRRLPAAEEVKRGGRCDDNDGLAGPPGGGGLRLETASGSVDDPQLCFDFGLSPWAGRERLASCGPSPPG